MCPTNEVEDVSDVCRKRGETGRQTTPLAEPGESYHGQHHASGDARQKGYDGAH
jgi:hypothetical protein